MTATVLPTEDTLSPENKAMLSLSTKSKWNPHGVPPDYVSETFTYDKNCFVFYDDKVKWYGYFKMSNLTGEIEEAVEANKKKAYLLNPIPFFRDGYLLLTKKRVIRMSRIHVLKNIYLALNSMTYAEFEYEFLGKPVAEPKPVKTRAKKVAEIPGDSSDIGIQERQDIELFLENEGDPLLFTRDTQVLRRLSDAAHTKRKTKEDTD